MRWSVPGEAPSAETLEARLAALISFYRWQEAVYSVPVAGRLMRGQPSRAPPGGCSRIWTPGRGRARHRWCGSAAGRRDRPPLLLPREIQAILDGCAIFDDAAGEWAGNLRDRLLFSLLAESRA